MGGIVKTYWNGGPCQVRRVRVVVADAPEFPKYWARQFVGRERAAVEIVYGEGPPFYLDNEDGSGWLKVTEGKGSPQYGHKSLRVERIV